MKYILIFGTIIFGLSISANCQSGFVPGHAIATSDNQAQINFSDDDSDDDSDDSIIWTYHSAEIDLNDGDLDYPDIFIIDDSDDSDDESILMWRQHAYNC